MYFLYTEPVVVMSMNVDYYCTFLGAQVQV